MDILQENIGWIINVKRRLASCKKSQLKSQGDIISHSIDQQSLSETWEYLLSKMRAMKFSSVTVRVELQNHLAQCGKAACVRGLNLAPQPGAV